MKTIIQCIITPYTTNQYIVEIQISNNTMPNTLLVRELPNINTGLSILNNLEQNLVYGGCDCICKNTNCILFMIEAPTEHVVEDVIEDISLITFNCLEKMQYCKFI